MSPSHDANAARTRGTVPMIGSLLRLYPGRSAAGFGAVFLAGLLDGLGLSMLLSMLSLAAWACASGPGSP